MNANTYLDLLDEFCNQERDTLYDRYIMALDENCL